MTTDIAPDRRPTLLDPEGVAAELSCGRTQVFELIRTGKLRSVKIGRLRRVPASEIDRYVAWLVQSADHPEADLAQDDAR